MKKGILIGCGVVALLIFCCCASSSSIYLLNPYNFIDSGNSNQYEDDLERQFDQFNDYFEDDYDDETSQNDTDTILDDQSDIDQYGFIEGSLGFPSEGIPPLEICAVNVDNGDMFCTRDVIDDSKYTYQMGYRLEVLPGDYTVYASQIINGNVDTYKAYYSEFVPCGLEISCPSHDPIVVTAVAGDTIEGVDPIDWYAP